MLIKYSTQLQKSEKCKYSRTSIAEYNAICYKQYANQQNENECLFPFFWLKYQEQQKMSTQSFKKKNIKLEKHGMFYYHFYFCK